MGILVPAVMTIFWDSCTHGDYESVHLLCYLCKDRVSFIPVLVLTLFVWNW